MKSTTRAVAAASLCGLGAIAGLGLAAFGGGSAAPASTAPAVTVRPANWPSRHDRTGIQGRGSHGSPGGSSAVGWASSNWSGYAVTPSTVTPFTGITSQWTVPSVAPSRTASYSAAWAGIDGFSNSSLIQTGTEQDYYNGRAHYAAWWTTSAQGFAEQPISQPVVPGDRMSATITEISAGTWSIILADTTQRWSFPKTVAYTGPGTSAEWILEAPSVGGRIAPLAKYSSPLTFDPGTVSIGGTSSSPNLVPSDGGEMIQGRSIVSVPSVPDTDVDGFNMAYGSSAPPSPSS